MDGTYQNDVGILPILKNTRYENILKLYKTGQGQYYYNLLQSIFLPDKINEDYVYYQLISKKMPWTAVSFNAYKTIDLWWLICLTNKVYNPIKFPEEGTLIKVIKPEVVPPLLGELLSGLN